MANINKIRLSGQTYNIQDENASKTVELTQAQYDALVVKDPNTFYVITDAQGADLSNYYTKSETSGATEISTALNTKQDTLVSGTNIKTINSQSILGSGNIDIQGGGSSYTAGRGISIANDTISVSLPISAGTGTNSIRESQGSASGAYSHAEGNGSARGKYSHAEGEYTNASANHSHSEGYNTYANGQYSHAEGYWATAGGSCSHAEGYHTTASTESSHSEGIYTLVSNKGEHSQGWYNVSNKTSDTFGDSGNTLFSVGNGTADNARHNAFEIRQNGDIYLTKDGQDVKLQDQLGGSSITVDTALDSGSTNPVENRVIYNKFDEVEQVTAAGLNALNDNFGGLKLVKLSEAEYNALATKDSSTLYIIVN